MTVPDAEPVPADRRDRGLAVAPGLLVVVAGVVLVGLGFRAWGTPRYATEPAAHLGYRLGLALVLGALALALVWRARSRWAFERVHAVLAGLLLLALGFAAWWLDDALSPLAWPTRAGVGSVTGTALIGFGVLVAVVARFVVDRPGHCGRADIVVTAVAVVVAAAGCVPLVRFAPGPSLQPATTTSSFTPPVHLPSTPTWSTTSAFWGPSRTTAVLAHTEGDDCVVQGVDAGTGTQRWRWSAPIGTCEEVPPGDAALALAGVVAVPAVDREFVLDVETGRQLWVNRAARFDGRLWRFASSSLAVGVTKASSAAALRRVATGPSEYEFDLLDPRSGHVLDTVRTRDVCGGPATSPDNDDSRGAAVAGRVAAVLVTCSGDRSHLLLLDASGRTPVDVDAGRRAGLAVQGGNVVVADRPTDDTARVRGFTTSGSLRWTQTWADAELGSAMGEVAALLGDDVLVHLTRSGDPATVVDASTGDLEPDVTSSQVPHGGTPVGCTGTECWFLDGARGLVGTGGQQIGVDLGTTRVGVGPSTVTVTHSAPVPSPRQGEFSYEGPTDVYA